MMRIRLPDRGEYRMSNPATFTPSSGPHRSRTVYAAAHVVADPATSHMGEAEARLDWDATMAFRRHLWSHGLGVADAMDTAQRGMGLDWPVTARLIRASAAEAGPGDRLACGVGTDQLARAEGLDGIVAAYEQQLEVVEEVGCVPIIMCSRALARTACGADDYVAVYGRLLRQVSRPAILHWLGPMFDPQLEGYWGANDLDTAAETLQRIIADNVSAVDGVKLSLLDADAEVRFRDGLPSTVRCYTGDDFNYPQLIEGDSRRHSDALLGVFDPLAPFASAALDRLDAGDEKGFRELLDPTVNLARTIFSSPTYHYKTAVVFLAWLCGHQRHFRMVGGYESARSLRHLSDVFVEADRIGLFPDPPEAAAKFASLLKVSGL